ncbi:hypothetical protein HGRIS_010612 [Hohenbuehelia grisea]|uniref:Nephrocystin 3-like N-terminal domain-containing protein n=1 Tax=Hohenbuehelia grisea TaxID=104357 RepID=A0ABR3IXP5_9AGAR
MRPRSLNECEEGTRRGILANIGEWMENPCSPERVFWIKGSLGTGKSAIAYTIAKRAQDIGQLGGNFFFSRDHQSLHNPRLLFPTIASHLARCDPAFKRAVAAVVTADRDFAHRKPEVQFRDLLRYTSSAIQGFQKPILFVFDGLDQFEDTIGSYKKIIHLFTFELAKLSPAIRILVTSRPEPYIDHVLQKVPASQVKFFDLDNDRETKDDVHTFLRRKLSEIPDDLGMHLPQGPEDAWFSDWQLWKLASKTHRSFVYATTALRFIADPVTRDPLAQLQILLSDHPCHSSSPFSELDQLYLTVLQRAFPPGVDSNRLQTLCSILAAIILLPKMEPMGGQRVTVSKVCALSGCRDGESVLRCLDNMRSIIAVVDVDELHFHRKSFEDFIFNSTRCLDHRFLLNEKQYHARFARRCIEILETRWAPEIIDEVSIKLPDFEVMNDWSICDETNHYGGYWWSVHARCADPENVHLADFLRSFLQSTTFVAWLFQGLHCCWEPMSDLRRLCYWNCSLKGPVLAAMRRFPHTLEACKRDESWFQRFSEAVGLEDGETGAFIENTEDGLDKTERCRLLSATGITPELCDLHELHSQMIRTLPAQKQRFQVHV